jgi:hypothetical protein
MLNRYNLFISHSWKYCEEYDAFKKLIDGREYFDYNDYSIPETKSINNSGDKDLYEKIKQKMNHCGIIVFIAGMYGAYSEWIEKELQIAKELHKPILIVRPRGNQRIPEIFNNETKVNWNADSIVEKIRELV